MTKINKHIQIIRSSVPSYSSMGQKSCQMIAQILRQHYRRVDVTMVETMADVACLDIDKPDLVFLGAKKLPISDGIDGWVATYLDAHDITYTGSAAAAIALDFDKSAAKRLMQVFELPTAEYFTALPNQYAQATTIPLAFPLFIKPQNAGGGKGIDADSVVRDFAAFTAKVAAIHERFQSPALVETYLSGREFSVAIMKNLASDELMAMPIELVTDVNALGDRILGQTIKAADTERVLAVQDSAIRQQVSDLAKQVFIALGARDYGRIDIRFDANMAAYFLEANLIPGLAQHDFTSYFTSACRLNRAMNYETMVLNIVELGLGRQESTDRALPSSMSVLTTRAVPRLSL